MTRDWKPGDVAMVTYRQGVECVSVLTDRRDLAPLWIAGNERAIWARDGEVTNIRPLVLIDPEDREQVERLEAAVREANGWNLLHHERRTSALQAALREFANPTPPKPEEPTGLYARVEDTEGRVWVRTATQASVWRRECRNSDGERYLIPQDGCEDYDRITAVRVLSEGVTP